jgi:hypothetical protein
MSWFTTMTDLYQNKLGSSLQQLAEVSKTDGYWAATRQGINWVLVWFTCAMVSIYTKLEILYNTYRDKTANQECRIFRIAHSQGSTCWRTGTPGLESTEKTGWSNGTPKILEELDFLRTFKEYHDINNIRINFQLGDKSGVRYLEQGNVELSTLGPNDLCFSKNPKRKILCAVRIRGGVETDITDIVNQYVTVESNRVIKIGAIEQADYSPMFTENDQLMVIDSEAKQHTVNVTQKPHYFIVSNGGSIEISSDHTPESLVNTIDPNGEDEPVAGLVAQIESDTSNDGDSNSNELVL